MMRSRSWVHRTRPAVLIGAALLAGCKGEERAPYSGPDVAASAAPDVAFTYAYDFLLPNAAVAALQEQHAAACEKLGPARCRIIGMRYVVVPGGDVSGSLTVKLDRDLARAFGRDGVATASRLGAKLTSATIQGEDMAPQIAAAGAGATSASDQIGEVERKLAQGGLGDRERTALSNQLADLRKVREQNRVDQAAAAAAVAATPMTLTYQGSPAVGIFDTPLGGAGAALMASLTTMLSLVLYVLAYGLPWIGLALAGLALWRTRWVRRLRDYVLPQSGVNE